MKVYDPHILTPNPYVRLIVPVMFTVGVYTAGIYSVAVWEIDRYSLATAIRNGITICPGWFTPLEKF